MVYFWTKIAITVVKPVFLSLNSSEKETKQQITSQMTLIRHTSCKRGTQMDTQRSRNLDSGNREDMFDGEGEIRCGRKKVAGEGREKCFPSHDWEGN